MQIFSLYYAQYARIFADLPFDSPAEPLTWRFWGRIRAPPPRGPGSQRLNLPAKIMFFYIEHNGFNTFVHVSRTSDPVRTCLQQGKLQKCEGSWRKMAGIGMNFFDF
jgi:hypothetical protein